MASEAITLPADWTTLAPLALSTTPKSTLGPRHAAYWPLWVNIVAPLASTLIFVLVQAVLLRIDDPGLRRAKRRLGKAGGQADTEAGASAANRQAASGSAPAATSGDAAAAAKPTTSEAGIQCEIIRADHLAQQQGPTGSMRRRTSSAGSVPESDTMRLLEGMLLRPRRPLSRRRLSESEHERASESGGAGGGNAPLAAAGQSAGAAALPGVSVTQSLTGPGAKRFAAGLHHRLLAATRSQQQQQQQEKGRKGSTSEV